MVKTVKAKPAAAASTKKTPAKKAPPKKAPAKKAPPKKAPATSTSKRKAAVEEESSADEQPPKAKRKTSTGAKKTKSKTKSKPTAAEKAEKVAAKSAADLKRDQEMEGAGEEKWVDETDGESGPPVGSKEWHVNRLSMLSTPYSTRAYICYQTTGRNSGSRSLRPARRVPAPSISNTIPTACLNTTLLRTNGCIDSFANGELSLWPLNSQFLTVL